MKFSRSTPTPQLYNLDAEQGLLAAILDEGADGETFAACLTAGVSEESFYKSSHSEIWTAIREMARQNHPVDDISLGEQLNRMGALEKVGGYIEIDRIMARINDRRHASHWRQIVTQLHMLRQLDALCAKTTERLREPIDNVEGLFNKVESDLFKLSQKRIGREAIAIDDQVSETVDQILFWHKNKGMPKGVPTGFSELDMKTYGLHPKELTVLAARPSVGKTALALNITEQAALPGPGKPAKRVLFFSLEMGAEQLVMRMICSHAGLYADRLKDGILSATDRKRLLDAADYMQKAPILIDDSGGLSIMELMAKARREHAREKLDLVVVDYLQLLRGSDFSRNQNRENEIREISSSLKVLAKELAVPVLVLSQLNRASDKEGRNPKLSDLRESGSIEQDADLVLLLARPVPKKTSAFDEESNDGITEDYMLPIQKRILIIAKQRNGACGDLYLAFEGAKTRFRDWDESQHAAPQGLRAGHVTG